MSIRSLMVVGNGRLQAAVDMGQDAYKKALAGILERKKEGKVAAAKSDETEGGDDNKQYKNSRMRRERDGGEAQYWTYISLSTHAFSPPPVSH